MAKKNIISLEKKLSESGFTNAQIDEIERIVSDGIIAAVCAGGRFDFASLFSIAKARKTKSIILRVSKKKRFSEKLNYLYKTTANGVDSQESEKDEE